MSDGAPVRIGIIGASWRSEYYLRIAAALPERFTVTRVLTATEGSAARVTAQWAVDSTTSLTDFLHDSYDYVVLAVPREASPLLLTELTAASVPVLAETPPAGSDEELFDLYHRIGGAPIQVAEQYQFQPMHAARLGVARSGLLGEVGIARVSVAHGYHGVSLIRLALGLGFEELTIRALDTIDRVTAARGRDAWEVEPRVIEAVRRTATLTAEGRTGYFDFTGEQYTSPIRARHISLHGTVGELEDDRVSIVTGPGHASHELLHRAATGIDGDLEGSHLDTVSLGRQVLWRTGFGGARLNDDELAVAEVMRRMAIFVRTGEEFYGLADASHDQYLSLAMDTAAETGESVITARTPWDGAPSVAALA